MTCSHYPLLAWIYLLGAHFYLRFILVSWKENSYAVLLVNNISIFRIAKRYGGYPQIANRCAAVDRRANCP